jgi:hypothetical protein
MSYVYEPDEPSGRHEARGRSSMPSEPSEPSEPSRPRPVPRSRKAISEAFTKIERPVKLIDMKCPPEPKQKIEEVTAPSPRKDRYPYGLQIRFEQDEVAKMPKLKTFKVGDQVTINGKAEVIELRMREEQGGDESWTVEVQIKKIDVTKGGQ